MLFEFVLTACKIWLTISSILRMECSKDLVNIKYLSSVGKPTETTLLDNNLTKYSLEREKCSTLFIP